jgi:hypothetical protein
LQAEHKQLFGDKYTAFRTLLQLMDWGACFSYEASFLNPIDENL